MSWLYTIQKKVFTFIGDVKWSGILHPFWFTINAHNYRLKGSRYREIIKVIQPGDILLRRFEGYVDKWLIYGFWNHAGIYIGEDRVIHAISEGVLNEDILDFMRTDHMTILRKKKMTNKEMLKAILKAKNVVGSPYDFGFDFENANRFSCTELISHCFKDVVVPKRNLLSLGKKVIVADDIFNSPELEVIWDSRT